MKETSKKKQSFNFIFIDDNRSVEEEREAIQFVVDTIVHKAIKNFPASEYDIHIKTAE
ncbi:hypothetical protein HF638_12480 [Paenibacillus sp. SZ31]|uniref:hypothetical protein n=1 Tax=Paenibacillus sp. SZ31 TaxID=2725555 RepID=UPI00146D6F0A|nr:hypothetical protein [Paenibacillus sp. SZ31]NMI04799.1 hypothetical protein [Paenibacillus sp. SZ31]